MDDQTVTGKVLVIDDEAPIRKFIGISLEAHGYELLEAESGKQGLEVAAFKNPDLIVLDLGLPDMDGKTVIKKFREWTDTPILVLSVRTDEQEKIDALDAGANDYVTKPFGIGEFLARIRALARIHKMEKEHAEEAFFAQGKLKIDFVARTVDLDGQPVKLTKKEYDLLRILVRNAGKVVTHDFLLKQVWGPAHTNDAQYLRVHIGNLREKLADDPAKPHFILTEPGVGYRFLAA